MKSFSASILSRVNIPEKGRILVAFSGGEDSLFLLCALSSLAPERTEALYVNHNIRKEDELEREIALNRKNAASLSIPFNIVEIPPGRINERAKSGNIGIEAAARDERYSILKAFAFEHGFDWIATAHHQDDQTETLIMRMMDHSPFWQWGGIREREGNIVRPILSFTKEEIRACIRTSGLAFSLDSTNSDTCYRRNFIRFNILPLITPGEKALISRIASNVSSFALSPVAFRVLTPLYASFSRSEFLSSLPPVREKTLYSVFSVFGEKERVSRRYLSQIVRSAENGGGRVENERYVFFTGGDEIRAYRKIDAFSVPYSGEDTALPYSLRVDLSMENELTLKIPSDVLSRSCIRTNREGDTIVLIDGKRKVSSLLKERKVPYALVLETDGEINAVFTSFLGGRDRISSSLRGREGRCVTVVSVFLDCERKKR